MLVFSLCSKCPNLCSLGFQVPRKHSTRLDPFRAVSGTSHLVQGLWNWFQTGREKEREKERKKTLLKSEHKSHEEK